MDLIAEISELRQRIVDRLREVLPEENTAPEKLHAAMRYGVLEPGKCVRGCLVYASGMALGIERTRLDRLACAVELVHAFSLIHDDLPCVDNDSIRRGRPSCHVVYGEATAMLAGNALLLCAINEVAADEGLQASQRNVGVGRLCRATGSVGLVGGQQLDIELENTAEYGLDMIEGVYKRKTGCLIHASVMLPTELVSISQSWRDALDSYGWKVGLAFQIRDDLKDMAQDSRLEKPDSQHTYPTFLGVEPSRKRLADLGERALKELEGFGDQANLLRGLAKAFTTCSGDGNFSLKS